MSGVRASSTRIEFDFVDDGEGVAALDHLRHVVLHVIAQIVEPELVVRSVSDVGGVGVPALLVVQSMHDDADAHPEEIVNLAHPVGVAAGEIIVDRHDVHAFARQRIEIDGGRCDERLALAGTHFRDRAFVQNEPAHELNVEMTLFERALGGFANGGEGGRINVVKRLAGFQLGAKLFGLRAQLLIGERLELRFESVDRGDGWTIALQATIIRRAKDPLHDRVELQRAEHDRPFHSARRSFLRSPKDAGEPLTRAPGRRQQKARNERQNARFAPDEQDFSRDRRRAGACQ